MEFSIFISQFSQSWNFQSALLFFRIFLSTKCCSIASQMAHTQPSLAQLFPRPVLGNYKLLISKRSKRLELMRTLQYSEVQFSHWFAGDSSIKVTLNRRLFWNDLSKSIQGYRPDQLTSFQLRREKSESTVANQTVASTIETAAQTSASISNFMNTVLIVDPDLRIGKTCTKPLECWWKTISMLKM